MDEEERIDGEFRQLLDGLSDDEFWEYIRSWKDDESLFDEMINWDTETKEEAIDELKAIVKDKDRVDVTFIDTLGVNEVQVELNYKGKKYSGCLSEC